MRQDKTENHKDRPFIKHAGFTLVEILIALTLFSITLIMIYSGLHSSARSWQLGEQLTEQNDNQRLGLSFVRRQISQAVPLIYVDKKDNPILFNGKQNSIRFVSHMPTHTDLAGLYFLNISLAKQGENNNLVLRYQPVHPGMKLSGSVSSKTITLLEDIGDIAFAYYGKMEDNDRPGWEDEWLGQPKLPGLVRLQITASDPRHYWPELLVPIHSQSEKGQPQLSLLTDKATRSF